MNAKETGKPHGCEYNTQPRFQQCIQNHFNNLKPFCPMQLLQDLLNVADLTYIQHKRRLLVHKGKRMLVNWQEKCRGAAAAAPSNLLDTMAAGRKWCPVQHQQHHLSLAMTSRMKCCKKCFYAVQEFQVPILPSTTDMQSLFYLKPSQSIIC